MGDELGVNRGIEGVRVIVPATAANLGPGFDVLGLALNLYNTFTVSPADALQIEVSGYGTGLPVDASNLFYVAFSHLYQVRGISTPAVQIGMALTIPPEKGLGSSATAVVGGLVAANTMLGGVCSEQELVRYAVELEHGRHADNVAPALMGGLVVNTHDGDDLLSVRVPFPNDIRAVLLIPDFGMDTMQGRALMPRQYSKEDVVYNTSRVALFLSAIQTGRYDLLGVAMQDRLHQPYRSRLFPMLPDFIQVARGAGAYGACLSGGGSSILALAEPGQAESVGKALLDVALRSEVGGEVKILDVSRKGAEATIL